MLWRRGRTFFVRERLMKSGQLLPQRRSSGKNNRKSDEPQYQSQSHFRLHNRPHMNRARSDFCRAQEPSRQRLRRNLSAEGLRRNTRKILGAVLQIGRTGRVGTTGASRRFSRGVVRANRRIRGLSIVSLHGRYGALFRPFRALHFCYMYPGAYAAGFIFAPLRGFT